MKRFGWRTKKRYALIPVVIVVALCALGKPFSDGAIEVSGTVWEWTNAPAGQHSMVLWEEGSPEGAVVVPMTGAAVTVYHARDHAKEPIDESNDFREDTVTDESGTFSTRSVTNPESHHAVLRVRRDGFCYLEAKFLHPNPEFKGQDNCFGHTATVLMVRKR